MTDSIKRINKYLLELSKSKSLHQEEIHCLHSGDEREAVLLVSDIRAILQAASAQPAGVPEWCTQDKALLDWLDQNLFSRELDDWDSKRCGKDVSMWVFFAPTRHGGGTARQRIAEAMTAQHGYRPAPSLPDDGGTK